MGLAVGVTPYIIGATVVAAGTSLPELVSSVLAVVRGAPVIVVGTVVGSKVAKVVFIIGIAAAVGGHLRIDRELMRVGLPLLAAWAAFLVVAIWTDPFWRYEGLLALVGVGTCVHFTLSESRRLDEVASDLVGQIEELEMDVLVREKRVGLRSYAMTVITLAIVFVMADQLVRSTRTIADALALGGELVAITAFSSGISLPEVTVSVAAFRRDEAETIVRNFLRSNAFDTFGIMGIESLVGTLTVSRSVRG